MCRETEIFLRTEKDQREVSEQEIQKTRRNSNMDESMSGFCSKASAGGSRSSGGSGNNNKCGRWNPTAEQVKVLTDLFRSGLRTPTTDQIQKISFQLSFYGKIESKNVFYWFQNHKARERQKRRRIVSVHHVQDHIREEKSFAPPKQIQEQVTDAERVIETLQLFPLNSYEEPEEKMRFMRNEYKATGFGREMDYMQILPLDLRLSFL